MRASLPKALLLGVVALVLSSVAGCKRAPREGGLDAAAAQLPVVRAESEGLLLTWIDDKGDFHVETRVGEVPVMGRDAVRVVDPNKEDVAHGDVVTVVDLREPRGDGAYPVRTMTRAEFEAIAVARREQAGPTLASAAPQQPPPSPNSTDQPSVASPPTAAASRGVVVIYGAEWCGACHDAARYLRRKGIAYVEKDIENDPAAAKEMQQKLAKSGMRGGSIPVIDVRGKLMVGFDPGQLDAALGQAL
jgi:glutaredoxin